MSLKVVVRQLALIFWLLSLILIFFVVIPHLFNFLFPDYPILAKWLVTFDWRIVIIFIINLLTLGSSLLLLSGLAKVRSFLDDGKTFFLTYLLISFYFAYYLSHSFSIFPNTLVFLVLLIFIFLLWLPNWLVFIAYFNFKDLLNLLVWDKRKAIRTTQNMVMASPAFLLLIFKRLLVVLLIIILSIAIGFGLMKAFYWYQHQQSRKALNPTISDYQPKIITGNVKVVIYGDKFGLEHNDRNFLWNSTLRKNVKVDMWTNNKIIFTTPLDWPLGKYTLKIKRFVFWPPEGRIILVQSPPIKFKVVDRLLKKSGWPEFLDQIPRLNNEVRRLNGF